MGTEATKGTEATEVFDGKMESYFNGCQWYSHAVDTVSPGNEWSEKRERQYEHVKKSEEVRGKSEKTSKRIAAATVNKTRQEHGETKEQKAKR